MLDLDLCVFVVLSSVTSGPSQFLQFQFFVSFRFLTRSPLQFFCTVELCYVLGPNLEPVSYFSSNDPVNFVKLLFDT